MDNPQLVRPVLNVSGVSVGFALAIGGVIRLINEQSSWLINGLVLSGFAIATIVGALILVTSLDASWDFGFTLCLTWGVWLIAGALLGWTITSILPAVPATYCPVMWSAYGLTLIWYPIMSVIMYSKMDYDQELSHVL